MKWFTPGLGSLSEGACPNFLYISKKLLRVPMEILKSLQQSELIIVQHNYYISKKFLLEECDKKKKMRLTGAATVYSLKRRF